MNFSLYYVSIFKVVSEHIQKLGFCQETIIPTATFDNDLLLDSHDITGIVIKMEIRFHIFLPLEQLDQKGTTVHDLVMAILSQLGDKSGKNENTKEINLGEKNLFKGMINSRKKIILKRIMNELFPEQEFSVNSLSQVPKSNDFQESSYFSNNRSTNLL